MMTLREPWRTRLLFFSFAVNLVTIPMVALRYVGGFAMPPLPPGPPGPRMMVERMTQEMPRADGAPFRVAVEPHIEEIEVARTRMEGARRAMLRAIAVEPFDRDAVKGSMLRWQQSWQVWSNELGLALLDGFKDVSAQGREQLATAGLHPKRR